jgi:hypothetical protein
MSDREILFRSLRRVAARLSWSRRVPELGRLVCLLVALALAAEILKVFGVPAQVLSGLAPLLLFIALVAVAVFVWRIVRPTTLAQAAGAADARAGLRDELKSAYWFAEHPARDAFVEVLLARAARTAQAIDPRGLIPLAMPRSARAALVLALLTGALAWFSPRLNFPALHGSGPASALAAGVPSGDSGPAINEFEKLLEQQRASASTAPQDAVSMPDQKATWTQIEEAVGQLPAGGEHDAIRRAVAARDARLVAKLLQALRHKQADAAELDSIQRPGDEPIAASLEHGSLERLQEDPEKGSKPVQAPPADDFAQPTARVRQQLREQAEEERRRITGMPAEGDPEFNPRMRAINRSGVAMRELKYAAGEAADAGAQTQADGPAMGPPDGKGRSGGSSGEHPESSFSTEFDPTPVLAAPTERLEAKMQRVRIERTGDPEQEATREEFFAETRRRASQVDYESLDVQWRTRREDVLQQGRTPLSYREAVKRYFLTQHGKEEAREQ